MQCEHLTDVNLRSSSIDYQSWIWLNELNLNKELEFPSLIQSAKWKVNVCDMNMPKTAKMPPLVPLPTDEIPIQRTYSKTCISRAKTLEEVFGFE